MDIEVYREAGKQTGESGKSAMCLCGGGVTGAMFEVGVLAAFDDLMGSPAANEFDIYVGSSAGASVGSFLAQGITADRAFQALRSPENAFFPLRREDVYGLDPGAWARSAWNVLKGVARVLEDRSRQKGERLIDDLASLGEFLPAGLFRIDRYETFLRTVYAREGLARTFADLHRELYVVAHDLDSTERVVLGDGSLRDVDVATAVAASSAIPIFFEPVRIGDVDYIDGGVGSVAHVDVAIDRGAERILVINPIVPVRNVRDKARLPSRHGCCARMRDKGLLYIAGQAWGIANRARLHAGIRSYLAEHPGVEVLLIEPSEEETVMFLSNPMSFHTRREILDYARNAARKALADTFRAGLRVTELGAPAPLPAA